MQLPVNSTACLQAVLHSKTMTNVLQKSCYENCSFHYGNIKFLFQLHNLLVNGRGRAPLKMLFGGENATTPLSQISVKKVRMTKNYFPLRQHIGNR